MIDSCEPFVKDRLRRCLLFCLAVDYDGNDRIPEEEKLQRYEWILFLQSGNILMLGTVDLICNEDRRYKLLRLYLQENVIVLSKALAVPYRKSELN